LEDAAHAVVILNGTPVAEDPRQDEKDAREIQELSRELGTYENIALQTGLVGPHQIRPAAETPGKILSFYNYLQDFSF